jgi:DNA-binding PadR family transcriptional regulator
MEENQRNLTRKEEIIMLSILNLKREAYLIAIVDHLSKITGKTVSVTSVYFPLNRLEKMGLIESKFGEATAVRGGRRKKLYQITNQGFVLLDEYKRISDLLWENYLNFTSTQE